MLDIETNNSYNTCINFKNINIESNISDQKDLVGDKKENKSNSAQEHLKMLLEISDNFGKPDQITENIFQGNWQSSCNYEILKKLEITHIVCCGRTLKTRFPKSFKYLHLLVDDVDEENLYKHFAEAYDFINDAIKQGGKVLVHCFAGVSRSSSITLCYLMKKMNTDYETALELLKSGRKCAKPNKGFSEQLNKWYINEVESDMDSSDRKQSEDFMNTSASSFISSNS